MTTKQVLMEWVEWLSPSTLELQAGRDGPSNGDLVLRADDLSVLSKLIGDLCLGHDYQEQQLYYPPIRHEYLEHILEDEGPDESLLAETIRESILEDYYHVDEVYDIKQKILHYIEDNL